MILAEEDELQRSTVDCESQKHRFRKQHIVAEGRFGHHSGPKLLEPEKKENSQNPVEGDSARRNPR